MGAALGVLVILALAPLAIGSVHRETQAVLLVAVAIWAVTAIVARPSRTWRLPRPVGWLALAVMGMGLLQLLPLPPFFLALASPQAHEWRSFLLAPPGQSSLPLDEWSPASFAPVEGWVSLGRTVAYLVLFLLLTRLFRRRRHRRLPLFVLTGLGALSLQVSLLHALFGSKRIFGVYELQQAEPTAFMGFLVNVNFQASLCGMAGLVALGLWQSRRYNRTTRLFLLAAAVCSLVEVYLTFSRAAMVLLPAALLLFWALQSRHDNPRLGRALLIVLPIWAVPALYLSASEIGGQLLTLLPGEYGRAYAKMGLWPDVLRLIRDFPLTGVGRGGFPFVFTHYGPEHAKEATFLDPENVLLQVLADYGIVAGTAILGTATLAVLATLRPARMGGVTAGVVSALCFVTVQNLVDYSLTAPGIMVWVVALTAYLWRRRLTRKRRDGTGGARYLRLGAVAMCGLAAACAVLGGYAWRHRDDTARGTGLRLWALVRSPEDGTNVFEEAFEAARRIQPANYYLYSLKATQLLRQEQPAAAAPAGLHFVNRALFLHPGYAPAHRLAAELLLAAGRRSQGFLELRLALLDTKHRQKRHALLERGLSVRGSLEDLVEIAGDSDELRRDMLSFLTSTRRPGLAYRAMKLMQFAETARGDPDGEYVVVQVLHGAERLQELSQFVEGVLERRPASVWALLWAARLDRRAGRLDRALERVRRGRAVAEHPVRLERLLREEARILELLGDVEGLHRLIRALETPRSALATLYYRRAMLYLAREQTGPALADLRLAEQLDPETAYATRAIAQILEKLASLEAAAHAYEEVLRRDPKDEKAREALARVRAAQQKRRLEGLMRGAGTPTPGPEPAEEPDRATTD